jgi:hypothetical protein
MASQLNSYHNFIGIKTKKGLALVSNAIDKYVSPLTGDDRISLTCTSFQKLKDNLLPLSSRFGYDYLIKVVNTIQTVDAAGDATFSIPINMLDSIWTTMLILHKSMLCTLGVIAVLQLWQRIPLLNSPQQTFFKLESVP